MPKKNQTNQLVSGATQLNLFSEIIPEYKEVEFDSNSQTVKNIKLEQQANFLNYENEFVHSLEDAILIDEIIGLTYVRNFITQIEHDLLLEKIDSQPWLTDLQRRVQHYGYKYDYARHKINKAMYIAPLPDWALQLSAKLHENYSLSVPDQVIVNEYEPGQGIASHTDCKTCFRDTIISLSLGARCVMDFTNPTLNIKKSILLEPRSLIIMQGEARYDWKHGIAKRKIDKFEAQSFQRERRVSLTFRTVIIPE